MANKKGPSSEFKRVQEAALRQLEQLGGKAFRDDKVAWEGDKLIIPTSMTIQDAIKFLQRKDAEENESASFARVYDFRPWDVAYCTYNAMTQYFGAFTQKASRGFWGEKVPPQLIQINTGPNERTSVPWGNFEIPLVPGVTFTLGRTDSKTKGIVGYLAAEGPKKREHAIEGVFRLVEKELLENSLYRGKAFDAQDEPQFLDLSSLDPSKIVYSQNTMAQLEANLWSPLLYRKETAELGVPFKRAVLLSGDFGVGKTLAINRTGQIATAQGITFILVRPGRDNIHEAVNIAKMYQPSVVAFEDVDVIASPDQDNQSMSQVLDLFDGIEAKNSQVMLVLTSNRVEKLHKGMLRPGRLDAVIEIGTPDHDGIVQLVKNTVPEEQLDQSIDWFEVTEQMDGYLPAFIVEAAQRSLRYALVRHDGIMDGATINTEDLKAAALGLRPHFDLMQEASADGVKLGLERALMDVLHRTTLEQEGFEIEPGETVLQAIQRIYN